MSTDRFSKYKPTVLSALKDQDGQMEALLPKQRRDDRPGFLSIEEGINNFRLLPAHEGGVSYRYPLCRSVLPMPHEEKNEQTGVVVKTVKGKSVFNARVHGNPTWLDPIEQYCSIVMKMGESNYQDKKDRDTFIRFITGYSDKAKGWVGGIRPQTKWICYAFEIKGGKMTKLGRLEMPDSAKQSLEQVAQKAESNEHALGTEPFTDPLEGVAITIEYNRSEMPAKKYQARFFIGKNDNYPKPMPLNDALMDQFEAAQPLHDIYVGTYKVEDYQAALLGLEIFDKQHPEYSVFSTTEWTEVVSRMNAQFNTSTPNSSDDEMEEEEEESDDELLGAVVSDLFATMDRKQLKAYISANALQIQILKVTTDEEIRKAIRLQVRNLQKNDPFLDAAAATTRPIQQPIDDEDEDGLPFKIGK